MDFLRKTIHGADEWHRRRLVAAVPAGAVVMLLVVSIVACGTSRNVGPGGPGPAPGAGNRREQRSAGGRREQHFADNRREQHSAGGRRYFCFGTQRFGPELIRLVSQSLLGSSRSQFPSLTELTDQ